ncbi:uncharacterized protein LOC135343852 [Halichondria panicea]|uniref:uncharacterized protein LOC135343852 n=1 Tax=Halichondria panicea TaxID=6063 RepID=UPI00312B370A
MELCEEFFEANSPPADIQSITDGVTEFVREHHINGRRIAMIASGGTTVPVERNTVRFLDNFSSGQRGAASAEYFLAQGYAVIFLHRSSSLKPFQRHCASDNPLDWLSYGGRKLQVDTATSENLEGKLASVLPQYIEVKKNNSLHLVPFTSVFEYFFYLRQISNALKPIEKQALFYLAAAVSDFYIKPSDMPQHKVQSSGELQLKFSHTPKMLLLLTSKWVPKAFVVTFKLETEEPLLIPHAKAALDKYHHQLVVANLLETRRTSVTLVCVENQETVTMKLSTATKVSGICAVRELEDSIVSEIVQKHSFFLA